MTVKNRATLNSDADTNLADNTTGDISPADVRGLIKDLADSARLDEDLGTASDFAAGTADKILTADQVWAVTADTLTDAATIAWSMSDAFDFNVTIAGDRTLGNPTSVKAGQRGRICVTASGATRTVAKSSNLKSADSITWPIEIASGEKAYIYYDAVDSTNILITGVISNPA